MLVRKFVFALSTAVLLTGNFNTGNLSAGQLSVPLNIGGDLRYRHEFIDMENTASRSRERIRARIKLTAEVNNEWELGFQFASGSSDPVSTNQTLSGGFTNKNLMIDQAFFTYRPEAFKGSSFTGGKMKNPFFSAGKTQLIWDSDLTPEGLAFCYKTKVSILDIFLNTAYLWVEEREKGDDATLAGGQAGVKANFSKTGILIGAGYYDYRNTKDNLPFYDTTKSAGNTLSDGNYLYDYNSFEVFGEISPTIRFSPVIFADFITNTADDVEENNGWAVGLVAGKSKNKGDLSVRYSYRVLEKDAVIGAFADSDFIGGGTDGKGHEINMAYVWTKNVKSDLTYFVNRKGVDNGVDYNRFQMDMNVSF